MKAIAVAIHKAQDRGTVLTYTFCWPCARECYENLQEMLQDDRAGEVNSYDCDDIDPGESLECDRCGKVIHTFPPVDDD